VSTGVSEEHSVSIVEAEVVRMLVTVASFLV
jgi:hypothetical protein